MTATMTAPQMGMPDGQRRCGIIADLTPPELHATRRLAKLRARLVVAAAGIVCLALLAFGGAWWRGHGAGDDLAAQQARSASLRKQVGSYAQLTNMKATVAQVQSRLGGLMANDVDVTSLLAAIGAAAPPGVHVTQLSLKLSAPAAKETGSLDTSGHKHIGQVQLTGTGEHLDDVSTFAAQLATVPGVVDVLPTTNAVAATGTQFTITFTVTDVRLSNRFSPTGGAR